jgi:hypothetical protein
MAPTGVCQGPRALTQRSSRLGRSHGCVESNPRGALAGGLSPARSPDLRLYAAASSSPLLSLLLKRIQSRLMLESFLKFISSCLFKKQT